MKTKIRLEKSDGWYVATVPSLPGCISQGKTVQEAKKNIKEAIELHLRALLEDGIPLKVTKGAKLETVAINV
ncbi:MAG TPA: type II toxin-antitoxin system HicB family antitoxin [Candidatus Nanoarchaeia archaeon]|nr:type II toxin-antitoxin system HicB family antitoxin [Candidatus Nanoarchaeia archaeon]